MERTIISYKNYFKEFFDSLDEGVQNKILYILMLLETQDRMPLKFMRIIEDGLYELRIEYEGNIYRIFFCFDKGYIVILFNGFQKKTQKTPVSEIEKAKKLKKEYYDSKGK
ncbi:MAG: type II toxin-antitoxin system RelE/ParE family toxin [Dysgonamonadaceae bacterium]|jgi:putative addiction module killer protein|nr:type II toxin-antitoxin system RelE/ParE family toxin [Dysgonamonadaceae bacterium]